MVFSSTNILPYICCRCVFKQGAKGICTATLTVQKALTVATSYTLI